MAVVDGRFWAAAAVVSIAVAIVVAIVLCTLSSHATAIILCVFRR